MAAVAAFETAVSVIQIATRSSAGLGALGESADPLWSFGSTTAPQGTMVHPYVLAGMALYEVWVATFATPGFRGPRLIQTAGALLMIVPLGWRRRYPVAVLLCALAGAAVEWPWLRSSGQLSLEAFLVVLIVFYAVGRTPSRAARCQRSR